ncbi:uncharacterized protein MELLADRAFT_101452 [Melampsora larici-populina 98AG31]|uniref:Uncharacterized protein n=1 Tax=Melampsora larici-populina (strain 98AG31 / pathotype 3-4-7) TaxID=747676 RepID=F4R4S6_MELLP|nr:uncharacterized protein MELLADRAFT_101452 [Melampsora larici-populina 98AG31]EGG12861.1 hypothetical protein MELLADRAFT_101452 [Melampsora larici-populina 98AG31]
MYGFPVKCGRFVKKRKRVAVVIGDTSEEEEEETAARKTRKKSKKSNTKPNRKPTNQSKGSSKDKHLSKNVTTAILRADSGEEDEVIAIKSQKLQDSRSELDKLRAYFDAPIYELKDVSGSFYVLTSLLSVI